MDARDDAEGCQLRLACAREHVDLGAYDSFGELDEGAAVLGVTAGGGGNRQRSLHAHGRAQRAVAFECRKSVLDGIGGKKSGRLHFAA